MRDIEPDLKQRDPELYKLLVEVNQGKPKRLIIQQPEKEIALALLRARHIRKLNQTQLAELAGMKQPTISRLESGKINPTIGTIMRVAETLGLKVNFEVKLIY